MDKKYIYIYIYVLLQIGIIYFFGPTVYDYSNAVVLFGPTGPILSCHGTVLRAHLDRNITYKFRKQVWWA